MKTTVDTILKPNFKYLGGLCLFFIASNLHAQVHVQAPEEVKIGKENSINAAPGQVEVVDVLGSLYISQDRHNGAFSGGVHFYTDWHQMGPLPTNPGGFSALYFGPIMKPQWPSHYFLGDYLFPFAEVHSDLVYATNLVTISDKRMKKNIQPVSHSLERLMSVKSYTYDLIHINNPNVPNSVNERKTELNKNQIGFIAQDIKNSFPHLVQYNDKSDAYAVNYIGFIPEIVRAMQEQQGIIEALKTELETIKGSEIKLQNNPFGVINSVAQLQDITPVASKQPIIIKYQTESDGEYQIRIYDLAGKQVYKTEILNTNSQSVELPFKKFGAGSYLCTLLKNGVEVETKKLIVLD
jgi:hypothetical protein